MHKFYRFAALFFCGILFFPQLTFATNKDVIPLLECVQYVGNGVYRATFGYRNLNLVSITVKDSNSVLLRNGVIDTTPPSKFLKGLHHNVFSADFNAGDSLTWKIIPHNNNVLIVTAKSSSPKCSGGGNIFPYYPPPPGGKVNNLIGSELNSLYLNFGNVVDTSEIIFRIRHDSVYVEVIALKGKHDSLLNLLLTPAYGLTDTVTNGPGALIITGKFPIANLRKLDSLPSKIDYARPVYPPISNAGVTTTKGDISIHSDFARNGFDVSGSGVKVGVISNSYNTIPGDPAQADILNDDLPGTANPKHPTPVDVVQDYYLGTQTDEGRAMMQIVHDIAPDADLAFRTGYISAGDFAQGIKELEQHNCDVIVDDVTFITEPFMEDGVVAKAVDLVTGQGVSYFSAAGNFGNKSYSATFVPITAANGLTGKSHNFGNGDKKQSLSLTPGYYTIVLQWQDSIYSLGQTQTGTKNDLDIYLTDASGNTLFGFNRNNIGGDPLEVLPFVVSGGNANASIIVNRASGNGNVLFKYIVFRGDLVIDEFNAGTSTVVGQANSNGAMAVGAVLYTNTPAFGVDPPTIASFSSIGGTPVYGVTRQKPDFAAPNGVNTTVQMGGVNIDGDLFPNFFGTSCAAPHAAGVAALLIDAKNKFDSHVFTSSEIKTLLQNTSLDMSTPAFDYNTGFGFIQADKAMMTFASPNPDIIKIVLPDTATQPGQELFEVTVEGKYLSPTSVVYLNGVALPSIVISSTLITASVPLFNGNPPLYVYTPPISSNLNDGGYSDTLYFFDIVKKTITVTADYKEKKYGEKLPDFTFTVLVDSVPLENTTLTLSDLGLDSVHFTTPATSTINAGIYFIHPYIDPMNPANPVDSAHLADYDYVFTDGLISIYKMPVMIVPNDTSFIYGEKIKGLTFKYEYDDTNIDASEKAAFLNSISSAHEAGLPDAIAYIDERVIIGGRALNDSDLATLSFSASERSLINSKPLINSKVLINNVIEHDTSHIVEVGVQSVYNYQINPDTTVLVNSKPLINAKALINTAGLVNSKVLINSKPLINSKVLINGKVLINSTTVDDASNDKSVSIIDETDVNAITNDSLYFNAINLITGITAGLHTIVPGGLYSTNLELSYGLGKLTITPAQLIVKADNKVIGKGASQPNYTSSIKTFVYNDDTSIVSGPIYSMTGNTNVTGQYPIIPSNLILDEPYNYNITYIPGTLYVNPKGSGAKKVKIELECVDTLIGHQSGMPYVAHFEYENENAASVYVPYGTENSLTSLGSFVGGQPELFLHGAHNFDIYFDGSMLTWILKTYQNNSKVTQTAHASSASDRCGCGSRIQQTNFNNSEVSVYPNPFKDKIEIRFNNATKDDVRVTLLDAVGKSYSVKTIANSLDNNLELDLSALSNGLYMIKIEFNNRTQMLPVLKQ